VKDAGPAVPGKKKVRKHGKFLGIYSVIDVIYTVRGKMSAERAGK
jgi:hypothetical protein